MQGTQFEPMTLEMLSWCILVGAILGAVFDLVSGLGRTLRLRTLFVFDALCGPTFAVVTFFAALVITDGVLSPMLFVGLLLGFFAEHLLIGRWLSKGVALLCRTIRKVLRILIKTAQRCVRFVQRGAVFHKKSDNDKKFQKKTIFFSKNT